MLNQTTGSLEPTMASAADANPFAVGSELCWLYGEHYRVGTVLEEEPDRVFVSGMTSEYWISKATLLKRLDKVPLTRSGF